MSVYTNKQAAYAGAAKTMQAAEDGGFLPRNKPADYDSRFTPEERAFLARYDEAKQKGQQEGNAKAEKNLAKPKLYKDEKDKTVDKDVSKVDLGDMGTIMSESVENHKAKQKAEDQKAKADDQNRLDKTFKENFDTFKKAQDVGKIDWSKTAEGKEMFGLAKNIEETASYDMQAGL